ncbi:MAG: carbamate kinase [Candidatus Cloacimonetes bacterium]|nr:carbamate kinase [Candidatus Cloacimonadota bacterium]
MTKTAVLALGGNAIIKAGQKGTITEQFENTQNSLAGVAELISMGYKLAITHGNGPQVGNLLRQQEAGMEAGFPALPLSVLNAATEGTMGYMIEQGLQNMLNFMGIKKDVITIVTQVLVDKDDPSMQNPTKFIGSSYYSKPEAQNLMRAYGWVLKEDAGKGWRRVVPSPYPLRIIPADSIKSLVNEGKIVIAAGGGGIPVCYQDENTLMGVDAVIDKDYASMLLALDIGARLFVILTAVEKVCIDYGKPSQRELDEITIQKARHYYEIGQFPEGSMGPKIKAAIAYLEKGGEEVLITSVEKVVDAFAGITGTRITKN